MTDARYYVVGDQDVWMIKVKDGEYGSCASRDEAVVFAIDAAQKLGTRGECAHVRWMMTAASNPNGPTIEIIIWAGAGHRLRRCGGLRMGSMSIWHWILVLAVGLLLFGGGGKISDLMGDFAKGIKSFKQGLTEEEKTETEPAKSDPKTIDHQPAPAPTA